MTIRATLAVLLTLTPLASRAQGWSILPSGDAAFTADVTSSATFFCGNPFYLPGSSCEASGNTLRLGNNGSFLTYTFTGLAQRLTVTNESARVPLGTLTTTLSGTGPFVFPAAANNNVLAFGLRVGLTSPSLGTSGINVGYVLGAAAPDLPVSCCDAFSTYTQFSTPAAPAHFRYSAIVFDRLTDLTLRPVAGSQTVGAQVGLVPEPSTFALAAAGGLALAGIARRRRLPR